MNRVACVIALIAVAFVPACVAVAPVVQGKVVAVEQGGGVLRVQDEEAPDRAPLVLDITSAEIGAPPRAGDVVRIVYRAGASSNQALRVMNVGRHQANQ
ncbi:MAG: hypothetical protein NTV05_02725 [Acidobacteria bacterium]|nr:hypothetical protein [Acidobacteriota bacterium]